MMQKHQNLMTVIFILSCLFLTYLIIAKPQLLYVAADTKYAYGQPRRLAFATGAAGGTYYSLGNSMAQLWNQSLADSVDISPQTSAASVENIKKIDSGEVQLILAMNDVADNAWNGKGVFKNRLTHFRSIGVIYPDVLQIAALKSRGIAEIEDIAGKNISAGPHGSGSALFIKDMLDLSNIDKDKFNLYHITFEDGIGSLREGRLDAVMGFLAVPSVAIQDLSAEQLVQMVSVSDALFDKIKERYPLINRFIIPAGTYGNAEPIQTVSIKTVLFCRNDLPDELVYELTKILYEQPSSLAGYHVIGSSVSLAMALDGITVPLHPGAAKYYREQGFKPAHEIDSVKFKYK